jgi:methylglutaconyl-CoA hydratase
MSEQPVLWSVDARGVATLTLNRPEVNNAYDEALVRGLHDAMDALGAQASVRVALLRGAGRHFQAGADLNWIRGVAAQPAEQNERASRATAMAVHRLNNLPLPTIALVHGGCFGGGTGIVAACDIVIAADNALFSATRSRASASAPRRRGASASCTRSCPRPSSRRPERGWSGRFCRTRRRRARRPRRWRSSSPGARSTRRRSSG